MTATLKIAEVTGIIHEESPVYSKEALISDIGGALGLILGLNLLDVVVCSGMALKKLIYAIIFFYRGMGKAQKVR